MHYGLDLINFGPFGDPCQTARLARLAEDAGWEGLFFWDHLGYVRGWDSSDPWILLTVAATATTRLKLGTAITPLPRRRPQVLAETITTLDRLSNGRAVLGVGIGGSAEEYTAFGEPGDAKERAAMLDEGLEVVDALWSGQKVTHHGTHYTVEGVKLTPVPVQRPRVPIWVGGTSRPAMRRAARWDGFFPDSVNREKITRTPEQLAADIAYVRQYREGDLPFDVIFMGYSSPADCALVREYADAGATWWLECIPRMGGSFQEMLARIQAGPARIE